MSVHTAQTETGRSGSPQERPPADSDPIVGHKTFSDGSHAPVRQSEADRLWAEHEEAKRNRAEYMPTEREAIQAMWSAHQRLKELGWNEAIYCPKDGTPFDAIEPGSTGIFRTHYQGEWPTGTWWAEDAGDLWPSRPCLYRLPVDDGGSWAATASADEGNGMPNKSRAALASLVKP